MSTIQASLEQRFLLRDCDWSRYKAFAKALDGSHVRLTYDGGRLELMTISHGHERWGELVGRFITVLAEELDMPLQSGGSTTLDRDDVERALEPDKCFYLDHEEQVRDKDDIDLSVDPPPDLAVEIDISRSSLNRLGIYAALGVPEVWRFDGAVLRIYRLGPDGSYAEVQESGHFPLLPIAKIQEFLLQRGQMDETKLVKSFRQWVRQQMAAGWPKQ